MINLKLICRRDH